MKAFLLEMVTLATARGRLVTFIVLTSAVYVSRYHWLTHLSLWGALGLEQAPSIGLTRAYWLLLHGEPIAAWRRNKLIYAVILVGMVLLLKDIREIIRPGRSGKHVTPANPATNRPASTHPVS